MGYQRYSGSQRALNARFSSCDFVLRTQQRDPKDESLRVEDAQGVTRMIRFVSGRGFCGCGKWMKAGCSEMEGSGKSSEREWWLG